MYKKGMAPLWLMYPHRPNGSIGWRMGYGESYGDEFYRWFHTLSREEKEEYNRKFPEPVCWSLSEYNLMRYHTFWTYQWNRDTCRHYSMEKLREERAAGKEREIIFFWGHQPGKEGKTGKECLSQWYLAEFHVGHVAYCCMEQYLMAGKARLFEDSETEKKIMQSADPSEIKQLGRMVKGFDEDVWERFRVPIALTGNYYKFSQLKEQRSYLLGTGDSLLAEASPYDDIWGIGLDQAHAAGVDVTGWRGQNLLGFALMEVREEIRRLREFENEVVFQEW